MVLGRNLKFRMRGLTKWRDRDREEQERSWSCPDILPHNHLTITLESLLQLSILKLKILLEIAPDLCAK